MSHSVQAGDALFLPEGWWHQIDSTGITIAVNFWWPSEFEALLGGHMDAYYLRRIVQSLTEARKKDLLQQISSEQPPKSPAGNRCEDDPGHGAQNPGQGPVRWQDQNESVDWRQALYPWAEEKEAHVPHQAEVAASECTGQCQPRADQSAEGAVSSGGERKRRHREVGAAWQVLPTLKDFPAIAQRIQLARRETPKGKRPRFDHACKFPAAAEAYFL